MSFKENDKFTSFSLIGSYLHFDIDSYLHASVIATVHG